MGVTVAKPKSSLYGVLVGRGGRVLRRVESRFLEGTREMIGGVWGRREGDGVRWNVVLGSESGVDGS